MIRSELVLEIYLIEIDRTLNSKCISKITKIRLEINFKIGSMFIFYFNFDLF